MPMTFQSDLSKEFTIFTITKDVMYDEFRNTLRSYAETGTTSFEIFDFRNSSEYSFTAEQIDQLIDDAKSSTNSRPFGSKTALVVNNDVDYGMSRVYQALSIAEGLTWETGIFRSLDEAYKWLNLSQEESRT